MGFCLLDTGAMYQMMWVLLFVVGYRCNVSDDVGFCLLDTGAMYQMMWGFVCWIQKRYIR